MELALGVLGIFFVADLVVACGLVGLLRLVERGSREEGNERLPLRPALGVSIYLGIAALLIYGGLFLFLRGVRG